VVSVQKDTVCLCRYKDAEYVKQRWNASNLLCCPVEVSMAGTNARQAIATAQMSVVGVVTLGLAAGADVDGR
jgi:hypothetical protein